MNQNILEGKWMQLRGSIREKWGELTDDELDQIAGDVVGGQRNRVRKKRCERQDAKAPRSDRNDTFLFSWRHGVLAFI